MGRIIPVLIGLSVLGIAVAAWLHWPSPPSEASRPVPVPQSRAYDAARATVDRLPVKGWDRFTDFVRYRFGEAWSDDVDVEFGHNGCNTRDDILRRDLADLVVRPGTCYGQAGTLHDPYTGQTIAFIRRPETSNDPRNLLAVGAQTNFDKAFRDATAWLPPDAAFRCEFVVRQVDVKAVYGL